MNYKNVTFLSLGSDLGDKEKNIAEAVLYIKSYIGKVLNISNLYISEAWGFESKHLFLNNVIKVETNLSPMQLLNEIQQIQNKMGSEHNSLMSGYESRIIDIDVIYYNNFIYNQKLLTIPHKQMQYRKFVLLPLLELSDNIKHPLFCVETFELLNKCKDKTKVTLYEI